MAEGIERNRLGVLARLQHLAGHGAGVLAVPVAALTLSADGSSRVQRDNKGTLEFVTVEPGLSASGFVAVKPLSGALQAGDLVVIGFDKQSGAAP